MSKLVESPISFTAPTEMKERLQRMAEENGLNLSNFIRMSLMQVLNKGIRIDPTIEPSEYLLAAIHEAEANRKTGLATTVSNETELAAHLESLKR